MSSKYSLQTIVKKAPLVFVVVLLYIVIGCGRSEKPAHVATNRAEFIRTANIVCTKYGVAIERAIHRMEEGVQNSRNRKEFFDAQRRGFLTWSQLARQETRRLRILEPPEELNEPWMQFLTGLESLTTWLQSAAEDFQRGARPGRNTPTQLIPKRGLRKLRQYGLDACAGPALKHE